MNTQKMISFDNVSIVFGDHPGRALPLMDEGQERSDIQKSTGQILGTHDCSLDVMQGEISVLMGLSGSGKSTLLRAVNGLNRVTRGSVLVRGGDDELIDVVTCPSSRLRELRRGGVSMVFQQFGLLPWRSVIENVAFGLEVAGMSQAERLEKARDVLGTVGLQDWGQKKVSELSGGMQQRVGLARAFATEARILLMDEPFSALDPLIRNRLQDELLILQEKMQATIVFVSHDLEEAVKIGNTITIMEGGRIVQSGLPEDIVLRPANEYVSDFVGQLNPLSVLCVRDVMQPVSGDTGSARKLDAGATLRSALPFFVEDLSAAQVCDADGTVIGELTATRVFQTMAARPDLNPD